MSDRVLTRHELNRATLARQMLLYREDIGVSEAVGRLAGLQAQVPNPPYIGHWTRLRDFRREDLSRALEDRLVVRAPLMRSTLHLMTAEDYLLLWPAIQPALIRVVGAFFGKRARGLDVDRLVAAAHPPRRAPTELRRAARRVLGARAGSRRRGPSLRHAVLSSPGAGSTRWDLALRRPRRLRSRRGLASARSSYIFGKG